MAIEVTRSLKEIREQVVELDKDIKTYLVKIEILISP